MLISKILVCGGRDYSDKAALESYLDKLANRLGYVVVIQGEARGADRLAKEWAISRGWGVESYPADWNTYGKSAGYIRNKQMLVEGKPELVVAFQGGRGTADMIRQAKSQGVPVEVVGGN